MEERNIGTLGTTMEYRDRMASGSGIDEARPRHKIVWILESRQSRSERKYIYMCVCVYIWSEMMEEQRTGQMAYMDR